jgi:hypothetical protein
MARQNPSEPGVSIGSASTGNCPIPAQSGQSRENSSNEENTRGLADHGETDANPAQGHRVAIWLCVAGIILFTLLAACFFWIKIHPWR